MGQRILLLAFWKIRQIKSKELGLIAAKGFEWGDNGEG